MATTVSTASSTSSDLPSAGLGKLSTGSPSFLAAVLGIIAGLALIVFSVDLFANASTSYPLNFAIAILGLCQVASAYFTMRLVRVAWAFALSINGTAAVVLLFSAPRIRDAAEVSIVMALAPCAIAAAIVILHSLKPEDF